MSSCREENLEAMWQGMLFVTKVIADQLILSNILHFFLKRVLQPSVIAQYMVGIVLSQNMDLNALKLTADPDAMKEFLEWVSLFGSYIYMFLIGLEMDLVYLRQTFRRSVYVAYSSAFACMGLVLLTSPLLYALIAQKDANKLFFVVTIAIFLSNTASPVLIRIVTELKLTSSNIGRLAITSALVNDLTTIAFLSVYNIVQTFTNSGTQNSIELLSINPTNGINKMVLVVGLFLQMITGFIVLPLFVRFLNHFHRKEKYIGFFGVGFIIGIVVIVCGTSSSLNLSGTTMGFFIGLALPREGPTTRTMLDKLQYPVHKIFLPLYFTEIAVGANVKVVLQDGFAKKLGIAFLVTVVTTVGKVIGTLIVTYNYLGLRVKEGTVLGILLNVKGYLNVMLLRDGDRNNLWNQETRVLLMLTLIMNTLIAGPVSSLIVWWERRSYKYQSQSLEHLGPDTQLRFLTCVHGSRQVPAMLRVASLSNGDGASLMALYVLHLVELKQKYAFTQMYHQRSNYKLSESDYGDNRIFQVKMVVELFAKEYNVPIRPVTAISHYNNMHQDVCILAEETRASLILLPFHKEQRYDGKMMCRKEEWRHLNNKVVQHAPCTIGILVDRPISGGVTTGMPSKTIIDSKSNPKNENQMLNKVATIFFGGPDDREAASFMARIATHPFVEATFVRFLPERDKEGYGKFDSSRVTSEFAMLVHEDRDFEADEDFIQNFQKRFVATGVVKYEERYVHNGLETIGALSTMVGQYSLFIVGRGGPNLSPLMAGIKAWEECEELGPIGDLLALEDFMDTGSVLILQQHNVGKSKIIDA